MIATSCAVVEVALYAMCAAASVYFVRQALWAWRAGVLKEPVVAPPSTTPITVQLPLRNEATSAEGVLRAAAQLEGDIALQVLDDSDDDTIEVVDRVAAELRVAGRRVDVLRRADRRGYKAGALASGLPTARELVLVLDADFRPEAQLTSQLAAVLAGDQGLAFVQARWTFRNERSMLTRLQAAILDALFAVEQAHLSARGMPLQFNGTAGLWRRDAIERAGGWDTSDNALTEDLDLSFRAHEAGLRGCTRPELGVSTELPDDMGAFVAQQARWVRGGALTLRALGRRVLRMARLRDALTMLSHLTRHARQPLLVAALLRLPIVAFGFAHAIAPWWVGPLVITTTIAASGAYLAAGAYRVGRSASDRFWSALPVAMLSLGLAPTLTRAFVGGLLGRRGGGFARTPKVGEGPRTKPTRRTDLVTAAISIACAVAFVGFRGHQDVTGAIAALLGALSCAWVCS